MSTCGSHIFACRRIFWIDGKDIMMGHLNGLVQMTCYSLDSEPLALALDVEKQYMYWLTFHEGNIAMLSQLNYTREQCGTRCKILLSGLVHNNCPLNPSLSAAL